MNISAEIRGLRYTPLLCDDLHEYGWEKLESALTKKANFILKINEKNKIALSWWVSPKRTRSYPYSRVYDTLAFLGKKVTVIPVMKDEGKRGDRDYLQWDTISLMSLLGVYVIISYYVDASINPRYKNKITNQRFDANHIRSEIKNLLSYQSDALHWNLSQSDKIYEIAGRALDAYGTISQKLGIQMHSKEAALNRINELAKGKENFLRVSRKLAMEAQSRESLTDQPKEFLDGTKAKITIKNYLGGYYYFTCDEVKIQGDSIYLVEGKHTKTNGLPSKGDIKDGLLKMVLFTNLEDVIVGEKQYAPIPTLKLSTGGKLGNLSKKQKELIKKLKEEASKNKFNLEVVALS